MDVVLLSIAMVTVVGAVFAVAVIIPARRRGASLVNRQTVRLLMGHRPPRKARRRRNNVFTARNRQRPVDLTPLLSQGVDSTRRRGPLTRAS
ncbi:hypothetical protein [Mobilicoccus caccae]|uniref:Secreted protein n=1 Tax=Mobilicoccus caccae TaxID=1859295 RepID=A0ABQ6IR38_9MICO|nr:hypothetical protein [Mobilicoccus caccae]GMA40390.1 hypothetical protein GCM10025883_24350 [Mobilicoccus caccae]